MDKKSFNLSAAVAEMPLISLAAMIEVDRLMVEDLAIGLEVKKKSVKRV